MTFPARPENAPNSATPSNELYWQAYQYVLQELSADEMAAFDDRLTTDQAAREAVASAVALNDASFAALSLASKEAKVRRRSRVAQAAAVAAAVAAIALLALMILPKIAPTADEARQAQGKEDGIGDGHVVDADSQLAVLWAQQLDELDEADGVEGESIDWEPEPAQEVAAWDQDEPEQPANWMWLALSETEQNTASANEAPAVDIGDGPSLDMPLEESL